MKTISKNWLLSCLPSIIATSCAAMYNQEDKVLEGFSTPSHFESIEQDQIQHFQNTQPALSAYHQKDADENQTGSSCNPKQNYGDTGNKSKVREFIELTVNSEHNAEDWMYYYLGVCYSNGMYGAKINYLKAYNYYEKAVEKKYTEAFTSLGRCFLEGRGVKKNELRARELFEKAEESGSADGWVLNQLGLFYEKGAGGANQDYTKSRYFYGKAIDVERHPEAYCNLGMIYLDGKGVPKDQTKARELFEEAEKEGHQDGRMLNWLGVFYEKGLGGVSQDYTKAHEYYKKARWQKYPWASRNLGIIYMYGRGGFIKNEIFAREFFEEASERGLNEAPILIQLGIFYENGTGGVNEDYTKARYFYEKATEIEKDSEEAYCRLGMIYLDGNGVNKDPTKARELFEKAEKRGHQDGRMFNWLGVFYEKGTGGASQDYTKANAYYQKAMNENYSWGFRNLGSSYLNERGVTKDEVRARKLFEEAEQKGCKDGWMFNQLGFYYNSGKAGAIINYKKSNEYFTKSINEDYAQAFFNLGSSYVNGHGVAKDEGVARVFFEQAEQKGYKNGQMFYKLGFFYEHGKGGAQANRAKANTYYRKARELGYSGDGCSIM